MEYNSVCNYTSDEQQESDWYNHSYDYRPNWTPLSCPGIVVINY